MLLFIMASYADRYNIPLSYFKARQTDCELHATPSQNMSLDRSCGHIQMNKEFLDRSNALP